MNKISYTEAIRLMRIYSHKHIPFSFSHATYDKTREGHGIITIDKAKLRPGLPSDLYDKINPDLLLPYENIETGEKRQCFKCLIVQLNDMEVELI